MSSSTLSLVRLRRMCSNLSLSFLTSIYQPHGTEQFEAFKNIWRQALYHLQVCCGMYIKKPGKKEKRKQKKKPPKKPADITTRLGAGWQKNRGSIASISNRFFSSIKHLDQLYMFIIFVFHIPDPGIFWFTNTTVNNSVHKHAFSFILFWLQLMKNFKLRLL